MPSQLQDIITTDHGWQEARYNEAGLSQSWPGILQGRDTSLWRYEELLPLKSYDDLITMGEGWTPLVRAKRLAEELGLQQVYIKDERQTPTGSFKDRQGAMAVNMLRQDGIDEAVLASTGNKAAAYAAYCARANIRLWIFLTSMVPNEKLRELALYGAEVVKIAGTYDQSKQVAKDFAARRKLHYDPGIAGVAGREGLKTIAFEIAEQLSRYMPLEDGKWRTPDWYIQAVSGGIGPVAIYHGFQQLQRIGLIDRIPRIGIIQVEGCSPMVKAWQQDAETAEPVVPHTRIAVLSTGAPGQGYVVLRAACKATEGTMVAVDDGEAFRAMRRLARIEGYSVEPAAAVAFAGLEKLAAQGLVTPEQTVVVNCSGHTFPAEKHILEDQYVLDLQLGQEAAEGGTPQPTKVEEGLSAALERLDEQVTTIVVIDDNPQDSRLIRRLLQSYRNYRVFEAQNPLDGIDLVKHRKPDLVISDLTMPEMDGFDLLDALKRDPETANVPVMVISAKALNAADYQRLGEAESVWQKGNFNTRQLVDHVVQTLGGDDVAEDTVITAKASDVASELRQAFDSVNRTPIMVIDDNRKDARLVKRMLEATQQYAVYEVYSGQEALESLPNITPGLIVLDLMLPDVESGGILVDKIRENKPFSQTPVVVLTAKDLTADEQAFFAARGVSIWQKAGLNREALVQHVHQTLSKQQ
ncbi:MAG: pyridoxal-phosphate dependent enzyme [Anaerolineales bacterium]